jgi:hypothetical protein
VLVPSNLRDSRSLQPHILAPRGNERTDRPLACSLLERLSSLHPFFIIDSSVRSSAKSSCYSIMFAIHLHHALCIDTHHQGVSRKDTFPSHCSGTNKTHSFLPYSKSSLLDHSCDECRRSSSELKDKEIRTSCFVRQFSVVVTKPRFRVLFLRMYHYCTNCSV